MNTSPVDSYDGAAEIFTFGANSAGVWIFLVVSVVLFLALLVRASRHESRSFATLREEAPAPSSAPAAPRMEPMPAAVE